MMAKIIEKTGSRVLDDMRKFVMKASPTTSAEVEDRMHLPYSALPSTSEDFLTIERMVSQLRRSGRSETEISDEIRCCCCFGCGCGL